MNFGTPQEMIEDERDNNPDWEKEAAAETLAGCLFIGTVIIGLMIWGIFFS